MTTPLDTPLVRARPASGDDCRTSAELEHRVAAPTARLLRALLLGGGLAVLAGCPALQLGQVPCESSLDCPTGFGCGSNGTCSQGLPESQLTVTPAKLTVDAGSSTSFTAKLNGKVFTDVTWTVDTEGAGTIDASGTFTAAKDLSGSRKTKVSAALKRHPSLKASASVTVLRADNSKYWVMSYFQNGELPKSPEQDALHLAYSADGLTWTPLAPATPEFQLADFGSNRLRDPFILRKQDGTFVLLATDWTRTTSSADYWTSPSPNLVVADSTDLITFTNPRLLQVTPVVEPDGLPMHAWAPEAFYDADREQYGILWSGNDARDVNRIYVSYTTDFVTLANPEPVVFFDPGYSVIDATLVRTEEANFLLFKDESDNSGGVGTGTGKDVQIARSTSLVAGSFTRWSPDYITRGTNQSTRVATEGPFVIKPPQVNTWTMCVDRFVASAGSFDCWSTSDLSAAPSGWTHLPAGTFSLPPNAQHANTVRVSQAELDALIEHYGKVPVVKIKSTTVDSTGHPLYLVHSWFHGIVTRDDDTGFGQLATDFFFQKWPSLGRPTDSTLVSFGSSEWPGRWLRVNSASPTAWPTGDAATRCNKAEELRLVPVADRHHLLSFDPLESTSAYAMDATFKVVPALNGVSSMVSFKWCGDSKDGTCTDVADPRYLCHSYSQVFAYRASEPCGVDATHPLSPEGVKDAMSFTLVPQ